MLRLPLFFTLLLCIFCSATTYAQGNIIDMPVAQEKFFTAKVIRILHEIKDDAFGFHRTNQEVLLRITNGDDKGKEFITQNSILNDREDMRMTENEMIVVRKVIQPDGSFEYLATEKYRLPVILWLVVFFLGLVIIFGGWMGLTSIGGLLISILILAMYIVPSIASGQNPFVTSMIGSFSIACSSLYLAHGFNQKTSIALLSTLVTLAIAAALSIAFVHLGKLFGMGSEESMFIQTGLLQNVNLRGLLLGGIIIGCLGVLDDITTAQTAAIYEIRKANPSLTSKQLWKAGLAVGREHIASLINTLALAYVGTSLPLLLLFQANGSGYPFWVTLNSEFLSEEIVRTLVGSSTLLFAVPISTWFAATLLSDTDDHTSHGHSHVYSYHLE